MILAIRLHRLYINMNHALGYHQSAFIGNADLIFIDSYEKLRIIGLNFGRIENLCLEYFK